MKSWPDVIILITCCRIIVGHQPRIGLLGHTCQGEMRQVVRVDVILLGQLQSLQTSHKHAMVVEP